MDETNKEQVKKEEETRQLRSEKIDHKATRKKKNIGRKLMDKLFSEDPVGVSEQVKSEVIWPGLKELGYNIFMYTISMVFWGEVRGSFSRPGGKSFRDDGYKDYGRYSESPGRYNSRDIRNRRPSYDYGEIIFQSREAALYALNHLQKCIEKYDRASVADLNEAAELSSTYTDQYHGWYDLRNAGVYATADGWVIDLPPTDRLRTH